MTSVSDGDRVILALWIHLDLGRLTSLPESFLILKFEVKVFVIVGHRTRARDAVVRTKNLNESFSDAELI